MVRDSRVLTDEVEFFDPLSEEQKEAMRRLIGANAVGDNLPEQAADALTLMMMLGVHPSQIDEDEEYLTAMPQEMNRRCR